MESALTLSALRSRLAARLRARAAAAPAGAPAVPPHAGMPAGHGRVSLRRLFWLRWALLGGQAVLLAACEAVFGVVLPFPPLLTVFLLQALFNVLTGLRLRQHAARGSSPGDGELMGQLIVDLTALSAILFFTGGATNPFVSFYLPALAIAAAILPWRLVAALALYALACYSLMLFEYVPLNLSKPENAVNYHLAGMWLNFVASAIMIAVFVTRLSGVLRQREAELGEARERLLREARVDALNAQAAAVAHEIGTPLATLAVLAGELRADAADGSRDGTPVRAYLADLQTMEQQVALCKSILARLRDDSGGTGPRPLGEWLGAFADNWQLRHPASGLTAAVAPPARALPVDTVRLGQMLTILLDNAARSQQAAQRGAEALELTVAVEPGETRQLLFRVADRGTGIAPALRAALGQAPVASTHGGQGIGAYLAQSAAQQSGGRLAWHDRPGGGTVAELRLPAAPAANAFSTSPP
ncbi:sensor histidine kinase KdpD [Cupriavidus respiraculi]|uniref:histidine kinase n=2 Tax=Cupriavidus respiraculi TaxID=195930 RepID=A0ABN7YVJ2_9BURK|nr:Sensor histidine kinase RegB [Cupriavidus respiraculi]